MRYTSLLLIIIFKTAVVFGQMHDAHWTLGPLTSFLDFREDTVRRFGGTKFMNTKETNACISDEEGDLLFYTNGLYINDRNGNLLRNGDSLSPCNYSRLNYNEGIALPQMALFIPMPDYSDYYYLFHCSLDSFNDTRPTTLYYSILDTRGNNGLGEVVEKNYIFAQGVYRGGGMTACKHANGRDWWIIMPNQNSNKFSTFLLTPAGIVESFVQASGPVYNGPFDIAYSNFSLDGSKYVTGAAEGYITVFDFDRCSGRLSNPLMIYNQASSDPINDPITGTASVSFSTNGNLLYAIHAFGDKQGLVQYDLTATNVQLSADTIYKPAPNDFQRISFLGIAPNGKLYGSTWAGGTKAIHVVNRPDERGDSALFVRLGQPTLSANSFNLPNMPNYRLGALAGSGCDTLISDLTPNPSPLKRRGIAAFPNPANKWLYVEMHNQGEYELLLLNHTGQLIEKKTTKQITVFDTEFLPSGIYYIKVADYKKQQQSVSAKVVVMH